MFEIERVRDRGRKIGYSLYKGTETLVRDREKFEIEGVRDRESQLYIMILIDCGLLLSFRVSLLAFFIFAFVLLSILLCLFLSHSVLVVLTLSFLLLLLFLTA